MRAEVGVALSAELDLARLHYVGSEDGETLGYSLGEGLGTEEGLALAFELVKMLGGALLGEEFVAALGSEVGNPVGKDCLVRSYGQSWERRSDQHELGKEWEM
jgi:hypothetical protein